MSRIAADAGIGELLSVLGNGRFRARELGTDRGRDRLGYGNRRSWKG